jgi:valyl-tRNA synthetase
MDRFEARAAVLEVLQEKKLIEKKEPYKISAGHCYRCHTIIEPRLSLQWFVKMKPLADAAIKVVEEDKIKFYPPRWKKVYLNWMHNIQDWCISRQIWWGHRLPVWYCKSCTVHREPLTESKTVNGKRSQPDADPLLAETINERGVIVSRTAPEKCPECGSTDISQEEDVLDTWFSSWLWPFATFYWPYTGCKPQAPNPEQGKILQPEACSLQQKEFEYFYPTSVLVTASEILFFWVARMIMAGLEFINAIPFNDVIIHGTVRDERGIKMSKSLGNIIDPLEIIDKFGADPLRFSLMLLASSGSDIYLSDEKFLVGRNFCNKIWNAARLIFMKINEKKLVADSLAFDSLDEIDAWVLQELDVTIEEVTEHLENYRINDATKKIYEFFWHTFCDWYIEIIKDTFNAGRAKVALYTLLQSIKLLHPVMPFISEEIFQSIKRNTGLVLQEALMVSSWPVKTNLVISDKNIFSKFQALLETITNIRTVKIDLGVGTKKIKLQVAAGQTDIDYWKSNETWIKRLAFLENIEFLETLERTLYKNDYWQFNLALDDVDTKNFLFSLEKKLAATQNIFDKVSRRLNNENFLKNALPETVQEERDKFQQLLLKLNRLKELKDAFK